MEVIFFTVKQVAEMLTLSPETIREKLRKGEIEGVKIGKSWRVNEETIRRYLNIGKGKERDAS